MKAKLYVPPLGWLARLGDILMIPLMYVVSGTFREIPQQTHRWNNQKLSFSEVEALDRSSMVSFSSVKGTSDSHHGIRFHLPILGGWKDYAVLQPTHDEEWHIGWITRDVIGVSRIRLSGPVRMLLGPGEVTFFGIDARSEEQVSIQKAGVGRIGHGGPYAKLPLL